MNTFDLKGSQYKRKVIDDRVLKQQLDTHHISRGSMSRSGSKTRKLGSALNRQNIAQKLINSVWTSQINSDLNASRSDQSDMDRSLRMIK